MNLSTPGRSEMSSAPSRSFLILNALVLSLTLGFFDTIFGIVSSGSYWSWILLPTAAAVLSIFVIYILSWLVLRPLFVTLLPDVEIKTLATSFAAFIGTLFILLTMQNLIRAPQTK